MTAQGDFDRSPRAALPHRGFTEPADGALCSMTRPATDRIADKPVYSVKVETFRFDWKIVTLQNAVLNGSPVKSLW